MLEVKLDFLPERGTLQHFKLFRTRQYFYLVAADTLKTTFLLLKLLRSPENSLRHIIREKAQIMTGEEIDQYLDEVEDKEGELTEVADGYGIVGFVKFLFGYYLILITKREVVGLIGHHVLYKVTDVRYVRLFQMPPDATASEIKSENKYFQFFKDVDLTKGFYFSYTYDLTKSLQENMISRIVSPFKGEIEWQDMRSQTVKPEDLERAQEQLIEQVDQVESEGEKEDRNNKEAVRYKLKMRVENRDKLCHNEKFMWNHFLVKELHNTVFEKKWVLPLIHGSIDQANLSSFSKRVRITLISRRSRHFAGTRYLKRGLNREGAVANYVVTEQIVYDESSSTSTKPVMSSYLQNRGSIPLFWSQVTNPIKPKPDIVLHRNDSLYDATKRHIAEMLREHGQPLFLLNLTKSKDSNHRERQISDEFAEAIVHINHELPPSHRVHYFHYDIKKHKTHLESFIPRVNAMADQYLSQTGLFLCTQRLRNSPLCVLKTQSGIIRTNCIDSLDRTNFMQQLIGINVLGKQLHAIGIRALPKLHVGTNPTLCQSLLSLYDKMGDLLAMQYGGSIAHHHQLIKKKNFNLLPKIIVSFKRYWSNAFIDPHKQGAMNLFLGLYEPHEQYLPLWEMRDDFDLHHRGFLVPSPRNWWRSALLAYQSQIPQQSWFNDILTPRRLISLEPSPALSPTFCSVVSKLPKSQRSRLRSTKHRPPKSLVTVKEEESPEMKKHSSSYTLALEELAMVQAQEEEEKQRLTSLSDSLIEGVDLSRFGQNDPFFQFDNCEKVKLFDDMLKSQENRWKNITFNLDYRDSFVEPSYQAIQSQPTPPKPPSDQYVRPLQILTHDEENKYHRYVESTEMIQREANTQLGNGIMEIGREAFTVMEQFDLSDYTELKHPFHLKQEMREDEAVFEKYVNFSLESLHGNSVDMSEESTLDPQTRLRKATAKLVGEQHLLNTMCYGSKKKNSPPYHWYLNLFRNADELKGREKSEITDHSQFKRDLQKRKSVIAKGHPNQKGKYMIAGYFG